MMSEHLLTIWSHMARLHFKNVLLELKKFWKDLLTNNEIWPTVNSLVKKNRLNNSCENNQNIIGKNIRFPLDGVDSQSFYRLCKVRESANSVKSCWNMETSVIFYGWPIGAADIREFFPSFCRQWYIIKI